MAAALGFLYWRWVEGSLSPRRFSISSVVRLLVLLRGGERDGLHL